MLAALTIMALAVVAHAQYEHCHEDKAGNTGVPGVPLQDVPLPPGTREFNVILPSNVCPGSVLGGKIKACDPDVAPQVTMLSKTVGRVRRRGDWLRQEGTLYSTIYCD